MENKLVEMLRQVLKDSHETLEATMEGVTDEVAHYKPAGKALPIVAAYTHVLVSEDMLLSSMVKKSKSLLEQGWAEKNGLSAQHPAMDADWEKNFAEWSTTVKADLPKLKEYANAVYTQSDEFFAGLKDQDLWDKKVDLSMWGLGEWPLIRFILRMLVSHVDSLTGEISAAKGLQGLKGYPF